MAKKTGNPIIDVLSSFGLACSMLLCLFFLTLFGTLYQVDNGLYEAKEVFFSSWFLWTKGSIQIPFFPGGMLCMGLLSLNMFVGGLLRLRITKRNVGVAIVHVGIAMMLASGLVKIRTAEEGNLMLMEGQQSKYFQSLFAWEVAIWEMGQGVPESELVIRNESFYDLDVDDSRTFSSESLPFDVTLSGFVQNCQVAPKGPMWDAEGEAVDGFGILKAKPNKESERDVAGLHIEVNGEKGILWGRQREPWTVHADGRTFVVDMRNERYEMPFSIRLEKFMKEEYPGMTMARAYRSDVTKIDADGEEEKIRIQMNEPLRSGNLVLFQSSFGNQAGGTYSVFSVVDNVSDKWPEYSLWVVTTGMLLVFGRMLLRLINSQTKKRALAAGGEK